MTGIEKDPKWLYVAATFAFAVATFQISDGHWLAALVCFNMAVGFMWLAKRRGENIAGDGLKPLRARLEMAKTGETLLPLCLVIVYSIMFGVMMHDWGLGICLGLCMGVAFGLFGGREGGSEEVPDETSGEAR